MIIKMRIANIRITTTFAKVIDVIGVNSKLQDYNHILMWDFDDKPLQTVIHNLKDIQIMAQLPKIYILRTSEPDNYIAYCFKKVTFREAIKILGSTDDIDINFFKWGIMRKKWTLRVSAKRDKKPYCVAILNSFVPEDTEIEQLRSWVYYETLDMSHTQRLIRLGEKPYA